MRVGMALVALMVMQVGCSSEEPVGVSFSHPQGAGDLPFVAMGPAVDEAVICSTGIQSAIRLENVASEEITDVEWATMFETALADGGVAEMSVFQEWTCGDGSGSFELEHHNIFDFSVFEFEGRQDVGSWELGGGTGSYADLAGSGTVTLDWDAETVLYEGEVR